MTKISEAQQEANERRDRQDLINSIILNISKSSSTPATRTISTSLGVFQTQSLTIPIFRVDHYTGLSERIQDGTFKYSRYEADISGVKISRETYKDLVVLLGAL